MEQTIAGERMVVDPTIEFEVPGLETEANEEAYIEEWGDDLHMLVHLNQDVIVTCPWMDNAEVTLGTAMTTYEYPPNPTAEDEPFLISVVNGLLASRVIEAKEPEDPVDEIETEVEIDEEPVADESEARLQEDEIASPKESEQRTLGSKGSREVVGSAANKKQHPAQPIVELRQPEKASAGTEETLQPEAVVEIINSKSGASASTEQTRHSKTAVLENDGAVDLEEYAAEQPADFLAAIKAVEPELTTTTEHPVAAGLEITQAGLNDEISHSPARPLPVEAPAELDPVGRALEVERLTALAEGVALPGDELVDANENQPMATSVLGHLDSDETESFGEEDVEAGQIIMPDLEVIDDVVDVEEQLLAVEKGKDDELELGAEVEAVTAISQAEVDIVAEQILAEYIERDTPRATEGDNHYLDKIIEAAVEVRAVDGEEANEETEISEELEELFIELLDEMGVAHTPEIIENLVSQTIERRIAKNKEFEDEEKVEDTQQGGLSTKLKKPSVRRATLNDAIVHDRLISKIALELCGFKVSFSLN